MTRLRMLQFMAKDVIDCIYERVSRFLFCCGCLFTAHPIGCITGDPLPPRVWNARVRGEEMEKIYHGLQYRGEMNIGLPRRGEEMESIWSIFKWRVRGTC